MNDKNDKKKSSAKPEETKNTLEAKKTLDSFSKAPGQTGIHAPDSLDAIRKPKPDQRKTGTPFFGGVTEPKVSEQTYDCYNTPKTKNNKNKKS